MIKFLYAILGLITLLTQASEPLLHNYYHQKSVLVTGGCGFIGSHLVETLVSYGAYVTILDNFSSGIRNNIANVADQVMILEGDICSYEDCVRAACGKDIIFHCAALVSIPIANEFPDRCYQNNVIGTANVLKAAHDCDVTKVICSSSAAVYGNKEGVAKESDMPNPCSAYGLSKLLDEQLCRYYADYMKLHTISLRYFNVYGERQPFGAVIPSWRHQLAHGLPVTIHGDGNQLRDFVSVAYVVTSNLLFGVLPEEYLNGGVCNISTGSSISILDMLNMLRTEFPESRSEIVFQPARSGDIRMSQGCTLQYASFMRLLKEISKS